MNIGIDARWIFKNLSGIGVYTRELIRALADIDAVNSYILFFNDSELMERTLSETGAGHAANFMARTLPFGLFSPANQLRMPLFIRDHKLDVFHSTNYMIPLTAFPAGGKGRTRCVTTIHDLIPLLFPEYAPRSKKRRFFAIYRIIMRMVVRRSDIIITDSDCSRRDVLRYLPIGQGREDRILAIPVGVSPIFKPAPDRLSREEGRKTIFWVGRSDPYKNLAGLLEAFALARKQIPSPVSLRLAGSKDDRYPEAFEIASRLGITEDITWLGYISDEQLVREYQQAHLFVLPSRYEGFGLPVVEAMACGTPVVCSNRGSLPEIAGDAAITLDPDDISGMAQAFVRVLTDRQISLDMSRRGIRHAARYTWRATAEATLRAYREALK